MGVLSVKMPILNLDVSCVSFPKYTGILFCHFALEWDCRWVHLGPHPGGRSMMTKREQWVLGDGDSVPNLVNS